jgi:long-subunit acyl-CoA synthetase (AMP-forming)
VTVPVYPTLLGWQIEYILNDASTVTLICSNQEQLDKVLEIRSHVPCLNNIIVCDPPATLPAGVLVIQGRRRAGQKVRGSQRPPVVRYVAQLAQAR